MNKNTLTPSLIDTTFLVLGYATVAMVGGSLPFYIIGYVGARTFFLYTTGS